MAAVANGINAKPLTVSITLQPPEVFKYNPGGIKSFTATESYTLAYREVGKEAEFLAYDCLGNNYNLRVSSITSPINVGEVIKDMVEYNAALTYFYNSDSDTPGYVTRPVLDKKYGVLVSQNLFKALKLEPHSVVEFLKADYKLALWQNQNISVKPSADQNFFTLYTNDKLSGFIIVRDSSGNTLRPDKFQFIKAEDPELKDPYLMYRNTLVVVPLADTTFGLNYENNILRIVESAKQTPVFTDQAIGYGVDPNNTKHLWYFRKNDNQIILLDLEKTTQAKAWTTARTLELPGEIEKMLLDPQGNFFVFVRVHENRRYLTICAKDTLEVVGELADVGTSVQIDKLGNIFFLDEQRRLRVAHTNFVTYSRDGLEEARQAETVRLEALAKRLQGLQLADLDVARATGIDETLDPADRKEALLSNMKRDFEERFMPLVEAASTKAELEKLQARFHATIEKEIPDSPELFDRILQAVTEKIENLNVSAFTQEVETFNQSLAKAPIELEMLRFVELYHTLHTARQKIAIADSAKRKELDATLQAIEQRLAVVTQQIKAEKMPELSRLFDAVQESIRSCTSIAEIREVGKDAHLRQFNQILIALGDPEIRATWKEKLKTTISARETEIEDQAKAREVAAAERLRMQALEVEEMLSGVTDALSQTGTAQDVTKLRTSQTFRELQQKLKELPAEMRKEGEKGLLGLFEGRRAALLNRERAASLKQNNALTIGNYSLGIFNEPPVTVTPEVRAHHGAARGELVFKDALGRNYKPECPAVSVSKTADDFREAVAKYSGQALEYFSALKRRVPELRAGWIINDWERKSLGDIVRWLSVQDERKQKILILEGEAGTGKNVKLDIVANLTNRELITFSCNAQSTKEDVTFAYQYDAEKGTYKLDSKLIEALQRPDVIVLFDEINTLPPGLVKFFNSAFDYNRVLRLPDGREIPIRALCAGAQNRQNYLGVKKLSPEFISRANIIEVGYPPELEGAKKLPWEAEILLQETSFRSLSQKDFYLVWDNVINSDAGNGASSLITPEMKNTMQCLREIVKIANLVRSAYSAYQCGQSIDAVDFIFSQRETIDLAYFIEREGLSKMDDGVARTASLKKLVSEVIIPKISDPIQKQRVQSIITGA